MAKELSLTQIDLLDRLSAIHQQQGLPPAESRVLALLLISDSIQLSFDEIIAHLKLSKGAVSTALSTLMALDKVEFHTKIGDRKRYFSSNLLTWKTSAKQSFDKLLNIHGILNEVLQQRPESTPEFNEALKELIGFMTFLQQEMPRLFDRWENLKNTTSKE